MAAMPALPDAATVPPVSALLDLRGHTVLVTGAGSGLGSGIALRFGEAGAAVLVHFHTSDAGARAVVARIRDHGGTAVAVQADVSTPSAVGHLLDDAAGVLALPDLLVNNAGIYPLGSILDMPPGDWDRVIAANLTSVHLVTQALASRLRKDGRAGAIVNIASIRSLQRRPGAQPLRRREGGRRDVHAGRSA